MKSPLRKRIPRELKGEIGKYLVVFILMVATIGLVSGFLVADGSMIQAYNEGFEKYNIEDGNFRLGERLYRGQKEAIEDEGIKVYENYYIVDSLSNGSTMRFFKNRTDVNKVCLMEGKLAEKTGEIAIDRMYADNNNLKVGDTIDDGKKHCNHCFVTSHVITGKDDRLVLILWHKAFQCNNFAHCFHQILGNIFFLCFYLRFFIIDPRIIILQLILIQRIKFFFCHQTDTEFYGIKHRIAVVLKQTAVIR